MDRTEIEQLFSLIKQGDKSVLETIYVENRQAFLNFGLKYNLNKEAVLDIYQDAIIAFSDNVTNGKIGSINSSIKTYLFSIGKYMIYKKLKENNHKLEMLNLDENRLDYYINSLEIIDKNNTDQQLKLIELSLDKLGEKCQTVLKLFYYNGLSLEEIQKRLNYENYNTVKSQKSRCLKNLKELINTQLNNG